MKPKTMTVIFIGLMVIITILYDLFVYFAFGNDSTISVVLNQWAFAHPAMNFFVGFVCGGLFVHFLRWKPK